MIRDSYLVTFSAAPPPHTPTAEHVAARDQRHQAPVAQQDVTEFL